MEFINNEDEKNEVLQLPKKIDEVIEESFAGLNIIMNGFIEYITSEFNLAVKFGEDIDVNTRIQGFNEKCRNVVAEAKESVENRTKQNLRILIESELGNLGANKEIMNVSILVNNFMSDLIEALNSAKTKLVTIPGFYGSAMNTETALSMYVSAKEQKINEMNQKKLEDIFNNVIEELRKKYKEKSPQEIFRKEIHVRSENPNINSEDGDEIEQLIYNKDDDKNDDKDAPESLGPVLF